MFDYIPQIPRARARAQAIWSANLKTGEVKYLNDEAKRLSGSLNY